MKNLEETYSEYQQSARRRRSWAADNPGNAAIRSELLAHVLDLAAEKLESDGEILDIGCGGGWLLHKLTEQGIGPERLHGVDLLGARVEVARRRLPGADVQLADARELPYPDGELELVTLLTCLSSMPDRESVLRALAEARRVLAPGGLLLCYEPRIANPLNRATLPVPPRMLESALGRAVVSHRLTGFPPAARRLGPLTPRLYPWLARLAPTHALTCWTG